MTQDDEIQFFRMFRAQVEAEGAIADMLAAKAATGMEHPNIELWRHNGPRLRELNAKIMGR